MYIYIHIYTCVFKRMLVMNISIGLFKFLLLPFECCKAVRKAVTSGDVESAAIAMWPQAAHHLGTIIQVPSCKHHLPAQVPSLGFHKTSSYHPGTIAQVHMEQPVKCRTYPKT